MSSTPTDGRTPAAAPRPVALVTGAGRRRSLGAAIATRLAETGWDIAFTYWTPYDERMPWGPDHGAPEELSARLAEVGARAVALEADLTDPDAAAAVLDGVGAALGRPVTALVMAHAESVASGLLDTSLESFERHFAVNVRASWLLIRAYAERFPGPYGSGRVIALTSDHTVGNLPYGASKGALDRITLAAARELAALGVTANAVNPGPVDTGWMTDHARQTLTRATPLGRLGTPRECAHLVAFLCSPEGGWINGQLLYSNGGLQYVPGTDDTGTVDRAV
ncbi:SDR family oxidoreductase [Streptomyces sp. NPDC058718]|uniref:SDR family oxidoreductase n=1 Tax=Streptomyces sp. NPDC058718 TaxID=3346610 RepID=UPI003682DE55